IYQIDKEISDDKDACEIGSILESILDKVLQFRQKGNSVIERLYEDKNDNQKYKKRNEKDCGKLEQLCDTVCNSGIDKVLLGAMHHEPTEIVDREDEPERCPDIGSDIMSMG
ncbi:MAG: hypothetical protein UX49_C0005G0001, partial [Candidatus Wolfebacteria bacterium GW2011_GWC2_46_275]